ncbi:aspartate aminotransferase family protein [Candidatus Poribacteria bacterium]|nr:aspartate aminotransferase family protein [Candidatus Poribacteria bacterium]
MKNKDINKPERSEGDINLSPLRKKWLTDSIDHKTQKILDEDAKYFLHQSLSTPCLDVLKSCQGSSITDMQDRQFLDFHGNSVHQVGYGNEYVLKAVKDQLDILPFCPRRYTNRTAVELAKKLAEITPGKLNKVLLAPGGTTVVGMALKLARVVTGRFKTISWWDSFHGASLDAISIGGEALFRSGMGPLLPGAIHVPPPSSFGGVSEMESADYVEYVMDHEGYIGAFIAEPVRCTNVIIPSPEYWKRIREICDKHGALLIFDEIPICLGRTGRMFACEYFGITPDILCIGKGLGGGVFPMAAMITGEELDAAHDKALGHYTHEKSPVGCAAALATIEYIEKHDLVEKSRCMGEETVERLWKMAKNYEFIKDIRGLGLLIGVELDNDGKAEKILYSALEKGLSFKVSMGNVLTLTPSLTISQDEMEKALEILRECFDSF